jgi:hypothetical protein
MHEHEVRGDRAVYDHETEDPRAGWRRRPVADWGVGEELFDHMPSPRRRFGRSGEPARRDVHARDGRPAEAGTEREVGADGMPDRSNRADGAPDGTPLAAAANREAQHDARASAERQAASVEPDAQPDARGASADVRSAYAEALMASVEALAPSADSPARSTPRSPGRAATTDGPVPRGGANDGRRTIVIGRTSTASPVQRRRPPRTRGERLGHRPDRIAAWAVALGLLLIIIAFATG